MIPFTLDELQSVLDLPNDLRIPTARITGITTDSRHVRGGDLFIALRGPVFDGHDYVRRAIEQGAVACIVSREVDLAGTSIPPQSQIVVPDTIHALGQIGHWHRKQLAAQVVAVTGSNGKTTTKCMIDHVLATKYRGRSSIKSFNNEIGVPLTLLTGEAGDEYLVSEIGTNAPGEVAHLASLVEPDVGVITSIGNAHLEGLGGPDGVQREKISLFKQIPEGGLCIAPLDDLTGPDVLAPFSNKHMITFGTSENADIRVSEIKSGLDYVQFRINNILDGKLSIPGAHNARNAAATFAVCRKFRFEPEEILAALETFEMPDMRLNLLRLNGLTIINDCYNANPTSMAAAIDTLASADSPRRVAIVGDMFELGEQSDTLHLRLGERIAEVGIDVLIAVGSRATRVLDGASQGGRVPESHSFTSADEASGSILNLLRSGDTVLVKGSRAVGLETVVQIVQKAFVS